jgi:3-methyladenine DNA glycosylase AlkD
MQHHKYTISDLDNMVPWEKRIYIDMLISHIEEENEKIKLQQQQRR